MKRVSLASVFVAWLVVMPLGSGVEDAPLDPQRSALAQHLDTAIAHMDLGLRSPQYRESIEFLREHATDAISEVSVVLLEQPGSFRKWQVTYLIGEFGDESALALLRGLLDAPLPEPRPSHEAEHAIDLQHAEEVTSRFQAVMSTARLASHRPHLRDQVVSSLIDIAHEIPMTTSAAIYQPTISLLSTPTNSTASSHHQSGRASWPAGCRNATSGNERPEKGNCRYAVSTDGPPDNAEDTAPRSGCERPRLRVHAELLFFHAGRGRHAVPCACGCGRRDGGVALE